MTRSSSPPSPDLAPRGTIGMRVRCSKCAQAFEARPLAGDAALTSCPYCQSILTVASLEPADALVASGLESPRTLPDAQGRPTDTVSIQEGNFVDEMLIMADESRNSLREEVLPNGWRVSVPYFSLSRLFRALAAVALPLALLFFSRVPTSDLNGPRPLSLMSLLPIILLLPGLWYLLSTLLGRTVVEVRGGRARLRDGLWPLQKRAEFDWAEVEQVRAVDLQSVQEVRYGEDNEKTRLRSERHSFLQLLGPLMPIELARNVYGGNFWFLRDALKERIEPRQEGAESGVRK